MGYAFAKFSLEDFVRESNRIEGIARDPTGAEMDAHATFINLTFPRTADLEVFVAIIAPGHRLRDKRGLDVRVGDHIAPRGAPEIRTALDTLMARVADGADLYHPWQAHIDYETLHPFTDGNGRSGRALWLWQMQAAPIGFLHQFYYQTLSGIRIKPPEVNKSFDHVPHCDCDEGRGPAWTSSEYAARTAACKLRGGPCRNKRALTSAMWENENG